MKQDFICNVLRSEQSVKRSFTLFNLEGTAKDVSKKCRGTKSKPREAGLIWGGDAAE